MIDEKISDIDNFMLGMLAEAAKEKGRKDQENIKDEDLIYLAKSICLDCSKVRDRIENRYNYTESDIENFITGIYPFILDVCGLLHGELFGGEDVEEEAEEFLNGNS